MMLHCFRITLTKYSNMLQEYPVFKQNHGAAYYIHNLVIIRKTLFYNNNTLVELKNKNFK